MAVLFLSPSRRGSFHEALLHWSQWWKIKICKLAKHGTFKFFIQLFTIETLPGKILWICPKRLWVEAELTSKSMYSLFSNIYIQSVPLFRYYWPVWVQWCTCRVRIIRIPLATIERHAFLTRALTGSHAPLLNVTSLRDQFAYKSFLLVWLCTANWTALSGWWEPVAITVATGGNIH